MDDLFKADAIGYLPPDHPDWPMWAAENLDKVCPETLAERIDSIVEGMMGNPIKASAFFGKALAGGEILRTAIFKSSVVHKWIEDNQKILYTSIMHDPNRRPGGICFMKDVRYRLLAGGSCIGHIETTMKPHHVFHMWRFWKDKASKVGFCEWIVQTGHASPCESGDDLELP